MELSRLAAKQKRYRDVLQYVETEAVDPITKPKLLTTLRDYRLALATCWKAQGASADADQRIASLERDLDNLFNDARLRSSAP